MSLSEPQPAARGTRAATKVSVVVPTFNRAALLKETVESILAQSYSDFELIIVDNMSEDGTAGYIAGLNDERVRYFRNPNGGVIAVNRNFGIRQARGEYVALCDDDDLWLPKKLETQVAVLNGDAGVGLCYSNASTFNASGVIDRWMMHKKVSRNHYRHLLIGNFIPNSTVLVRRQLLEKFGYLSEDPRNVAVEDYAMWLCIARESRMFYVDEGLILYRLHGAANSNNLAKMAHKSLRVIAAEFSRNLCSPFYAYALMRASIRALCRKVL
jgi:glycosyltransferase involved in cell wall biosynthesis